MGRYSPIPAKYSEPLHSVVAQMLRLSARERPSAEMLLRSAEVLAKMHLDDTCTNFAHMISENDNKSNLELLISTIKVPQSINKLQSALPKACYPDIRPNSPTSWTVAEQRQAQRKPPPLPPVPSIPPLSMVGLGDGRENAAPIPSYRELENVISVRPPVPAAALDDHYSRRPLAPVQGNKSNVAPHRSVSSDQHFLKPQPRPQFQPSLDPIPTAIVPPVLSQQPTAPPGQRMAGNPTRLQYHHRMW